MNTKRLSINLLGVRHFRQIRAICRSLKNGASITVACRAANIDVSTLWVWRQESKRLDNIIHNIIDSRIQMVEDVLFKAAIEGNVKAMTEFLHNRAPQRWRSDPTLLIDQSQHAHLLKITNNNEPIYNIQPVRSLKELSENKKDDQAKTE